MRYIVATVKASWGGCHTGQLYANPEENRKELSGYVYLNTIVQPILSLLYYGLTLTIWVQDGPGISAPR